MNRSLQSLLVVLAVALLTSTVTTARAEEDHWVAAEGGLKDTLTGLVWSPHSRSLVNSNSSYEQINQLADDYEVEERDEGGELIMVYDDWRLPTISELQEAVSSGTLREAMLYHHGGPYYYKPSATSSPLELLWSAETRGSRWAWTLPIRTHAVLDENGDVIDFEVTSEDPYATRIPESRLHAFLVRGVDLEGHGNGKGKTSSR